jgi:hypothetical protein
VYCCHLYNVEDAWVICVSSCRVWKLEVHYCKPVHSPWPSKWSPSEADDNVIANDTFYIFMIKWPFISLVCLIFWHRKFTNRHCSYVTEVETIMFYHLCTNFCRRSELRDRLAYINLIYITFVLDLGSIYDINFSRHLTMVYIMWVHAKEVVVHDCHIVNFFPFDILLLIFTCYEDGCLLGCCTM